VFCRYQSDACFRVGKRQLTGKQLAAEIGRPEPGAFFPTKPDHAYAPLRLQSAGLKGDERSDPCDNSCEPVVVPAARHRIDMGSNQDFRIRFELALGRKGDIPHSVVSDIESLLTCVVHKHLGRRRFGLAIGAPGNSVFVSGLLGNPREQV